MEEVSTASVSPLLAPAGGFSYASIALLFSVPALGGSLFGYDIGATSYVIAQLQSKDYAGISWWQSVEEKPVVQGLIVSAASIGALLGSILIFDLADKIGRRKELRYGSVLYIIGASLQAAAAHLSDTGSFLPILILVIGRLIYGIGIGITMHGAPTYLAEMCPSSIRGAVVAMKEASIVLGMVLGYSIGYAFSKVEGGWVQTYGCSLLLSTPMLLLSFAIPLSCRWLMLVGREEEALEALRFVYIDLGTAEAELIKMRSLTSAQTQNASTDIEVPVEMPDTRTLWSASNRGPLVAALGLVSLQQITGQPSVLSYATTIFRDAGVSDYASILVAVFKLIATISAAATVEKYGRKVLLRSGISLMLVSLVALSIMLGRDGSIVRVAIIVAMFLYIGGYQFSFGPISWLIVSEVFPLDVRGKAVAISGQTNFFLNAVVQFGVPILQGLVGLNITFGVFAVLAAYSIRFIQLYLPETKGLTLEEIELKFKAMSRTTDDVAPEAIGLLPTPGVLVST